MLKDWCTDNKLISMHQDITKIIEMAALIPPSTAEVERSFSLMNLISTPLRKRLSVENLGHCMRICKFPRSLTENDYQQILSPWLEVAETKPKSRRINHRLQNKKKNFQHLYIHFYLKEKKRRRYCINFFLLYAHKSREYFLIFLKSLTFLKPRYFLKYKSNVLKYS